MRLGIIFTIALAGFTIVQGARQEVDESFYSCIPGLKENYGVSFPRGQTWKSVGSKPFPLTCHVNPNKGYQSDSLKFMKKVQRNSNFLEIELESKILNETSIEAIFDPKDVGSFMVDCVIVKGNVSTGVCTQTIFVGFEPLPPENFSCISYNWQNLNCTWTEPANPIKSKYKLSYKDNGNYGRFIHLANCPQTETGICFWDLKTKPLFRQTVKNLELVFNVTNQLNPEGKSYSYKYVLLDIVKPKPVNMTLNSLDPFTILINYTIDTNLHFFPPGFRQQIRYQSEYQSSWTVIKSNLDPEIQFCEHTLTDLIPFSDYKVEVRILSRKANESDERLWSDPTSMLIRTQSAAPFKSPETNTGSFEVSEDRYLYVYWKPLAKQEENGPFFSYSVDRIDEDGSRLPMKLIEVTQSYAKFANITKESYSFIITSKNSIGKSPSSSKLFVPPETDRNIQPTDVTKVAFNETLMEVSWQPPFDPHLLVRNYTVFWCKPKSKRDRPFQCDGELDWIVVNAKEQSLNVTLPTDTIYQVAVAANTDLSSSGMVWSTCTILHDKVTNKVRKFRVDMVTSRSLRVSWRFDCSKRIQGYKITYCSLRSTHDSKCADDEKYVIAQPTSELYEIEGLNPWTTYMVSIMATTPGGDGPRSEYLKNQTLVESPEKPESFEIVEMKTNKTLHLTWHPPKKLNGHIDFYEIEYSFLNFFNKRETEKKNSSSLSLDIFGPEVQVNTVYKFSLCACTKVHGSRGVLCSRECFTRDFTTGIGNSSVMSAPQAIFINSTVVVVSWNVSNFHRGGPEIEYEIRIVYQHTENQHIFRVRPPIAQIEINLEKISDEKDWSPNCFNASSWTNSYNFSVRAVTIDKMNGETYFPMWSENEVVPAFCSSSLSTATIILLSIIIPAFVFCLLVVSFKFFYWGNRTFGIFKDVSKEITQSNRPKDFSDGRTSNKESFELENGYQPPKSTQGLLDQQRRNISGTSDTTSGCESGSPSCDESEEAEQPIIPMTKEALANYEKTSERTYDPLSLADSTNFTENSQNTYIPAFQQEILRTNPLQQNPNACPMIVTFGGGSVTTSESNQRFISAHSFQSTGPKNGYVSLSSVCQLPKPNTMTFDIDFNAIPPPPLPTSFKEDNFKLPPQATTNEEGIHNKLQESSHLTLDDRPSMSITDIKTQDYPTLVGQTQLQPRELHVTAVQTAQPKTIIVTSCSALFKDRQSTMV